MKNNSTTYMFAGYDIYPLYEASTEDMHLLMDKMEGDHRGETKIARSAKSSATEMESRCYDSSFRRLFPRDGHGSVATLKIIPYKKRALKEPGKEMRSRDEFSKLFQISGRNVF